MNSSNQPLLSLRTALILLLGVLTGVGAGVLTVAAGGVLAAELLTNGAAFAGAVIFFHTIID
ncbi:hypothetical protein OG223_53080 [Streptomyces sp. NBC_01478]|uniref:hypothetical protein n=1 Tax=Streptomyces sp. NBC_01478 TaxID=2903882 RepID=UPI002E34AC60|nr:hypothetical protein [Streptomyces sp. NBC_01478]